jgi:GntR family transcriptional regulator
MLKTLRIDNSGVPIYVQIREQMLRAIGAGTLRPGEQLPTMREVAVALKVDLNTVRHAYDDLEHAGAIVIRRARGTYVAEKPPAVDPVKQARRLESLAHQVIATITAAGFDPGDVVREIAQLIEKKGAKS